MKAVHFIVCLSLLFFTEEKLVFSQIKPIDPDGNGYYNISTIKHLLWVSQNPESWSWDFELDNNIDASETRGLNSEKGWVPIGNSSTKFTGCINGRGFSIENLFICDHSLKYAGFTGINSGEILDLELDKCSVSGKSYVGGISGKNTGIITACCVKGEVSGINNCIGGFVGRNAWGTITNSYFVGSVAGKSFTGGFVGYNDSGGYIGEAYAIGKVTGNRGSHVGEFFGVDTGSSKNCFWDNNGKIEHTGNYTKFDYTYIWEYTDSYPVLVWENKSNEIKSSLIEQRNHNTELVVFKQKKEIEKTSQENDSIAVEPKPDPEPEKINVSGVVGTTRNYFVFKMYKLIVNGSKNINPAIWIISEEDSSLPKIGDQLDVVCFLKNDIKLKALGNYQVYQEISRINK